MVKRVAHSAEGTRFWSLFLEDTFPPSCRNIIPYEVKKSCPSVGEAFPGESVEDWLDHTDDAVCPVVGGVILCGRVSVG